eukprot:TRINITY_DN2054_c0_g2_i3.p1 TRINITY_DN2054_c0_g2~~TRINITY_DN2054_c0_g2_i3.p1  ORF type:complete len:359 (+),score=104.71 TRINITY_DN2054_c0_g2_i3:64-1140(+)
MSKSIRLSVLVFVSFLAAGHCAGLLSVFYGNQGFEMNQVAVMEQWQNKSHAAVVLFTDFCEADIDSVFGTQVPNIWNNHNVPFITWEAFLCNHTADTRISVRISNGELDSLILKWGSRLQQFLAGADGVWNTTDDRRAFLRLAHEMNANWYPWSAALGGSQPSDYVHMWQRIHGIFRANLSIDANHLQFVFCPMNNDFGNFPMESYWPGSEYVDWLAVDGYNWGRAYSWANWYSPEQTFKDMVNRVRAVAGSNTKPVAIPEFGCTSVSPWYNPDVNSKNIWLGQMCSMAINLGIKYFSYFNIDKETDWAVFGGAHGDVTFQQLHGYSAHHACVSQDYFQGSDHTNPRLITDAQFYGQI